MADDLAALMRHPLSAKISPMKTDPFLLRSSTGVRLRFRNVRDSQENMLALGKRQRRQREQNPAFVHSFQLLHHEPIVALAASDFQSRFTGQSLIHGQYRYQFYPCPSVSIRG